MRDVVTKCLKVNLLQIGCGKEGVEINSVKDNYRRRIEIYVIVRKSVPQIKHFEGYSLYYSCCGIKKQAMSVQLSIQR